MRLSVVIPTPDGKRLVRALHSAFDQDLSPTDEILIIGDTHSGALPHVEELCATFGPQCRYLSHNAGRHEWGHPQIDTGITQARGDWLVFQDDDDVFTPGAFASIRRQIQASGRLVPHLFRFQTRTGRVVWRRKGEVYPGRIGGHCIVAPNIPAKLGQWTTGRYEGDFDFVRETIERHSEVAVWCPEIISVARPNVDWRRVTTTDQVERLRVLRNAGREWMTGTTEEISPAAQARFWEGHDPVRLQAYLFAEGAGAGVLSFRDDGRWWITLMIDPTRRGQGIGTEIYRLLACAPPGPVYAQIRPDNMASNRACEKAGYHFLGEGLWCSTSL